jgi:hypothetical protein
LAGTFFGCIFRQPADDYFFHNKWWIHIADGFLNGIK